MPTAQFAVANTMVADRRWVGCRIVLATVVLVVALAVHAIVTTSITTSHIDSVMSSKSSTREYDLVTLPSVYDALKHPVRRIVLLSDEMQFSMPIIATQLFNKSYMELYSEDSVVVHVHVEDGVYLSFPRSDAQPYTPYLQSLRGLEQPEGSHDPVAIVTTSASVLGVANTAENGRKLAPLRIGRFYICIFCKGSWACEGTVRKSKVKGGCRRLIAIGFDAER